MFITSPRGYNMSPLVLLAVLAGSISAFTIRDFTGGNEVRDIHNHQENAGTESEEIPNLPADNIDSETVNYTDAHTEHPDMSCIGFFSCMSQNQLPEPEETTAGGYFFSSGFVMGICRFMKVAASCYYQGDNAGCPILTDRIKTVTGMYGYACVEPGKSAVLSILPCINTQEVQQELITSFYGLSHSMNTILQQSDLEFSEISDMMCGAAKNVYNETGAAIERQCSAADRRVFETMAVIAWRPRLQHYNCVIEGNSTPCL